MQYYIYMKHYIVKMTHFRNFVVVNTVTGLAQSAWPSLKEANQVALSLNYNTRKEVVAFKLRLISSN